MTYDDDPSDELILRPMSPDEVEELVAWAAQEGWNPGRSDARLFYETDPEGFVAAEIDGEMIGGGAVVAYGETYGFMGLFIVKPEYRGRGLGRHLWTARRDMLRARLDPEAPIGMDGVEAMAPFYAEGGFELAYVNRRYSLTAGAQTVSSDVVPISDVPFQALVKFDRHFFPAFREEFLDGWITQRGAIARAVVNDAGVQGYAVARPCGEGYKVGPLFAEDAETASTLLHAIENELVGETLFVDIPDVNPEHEAFAARHGMEEVFRCARMYHGEPPAIDESRVFGITTFELG